MDAVAEAARKFGGSPLLITPEGTLAFTVCEAVTARMASYLESRGIACGDIVAVAAPNSPGTVLLLLALLRLGAVAAPVNHRFPASHVEGILARLAPKLTIFDPAVFTPGEKLSALPLGGIVEAGYEPAGPASFDAAADPDRPASIIHTSASSGMPKAALHSFANHWYNAMGSAMNLPFGQGDCWLLSLPLYHIGGYALLCKSLLGGGAMAVGFGDRRLEETLGQVPVTHLSLVPTQLFRLMRDPLATGLLKGLQAILLGGSAVPERLLDDAIRAGLPIYLTYGSTEMGSQVTTSPAPVTEPTKASGAILPYREAMITAEGEILLKGPCLFMGYLTEGTVASARDDDGWFHSGDTGSLDETGFLTLLGRRDNMFIAGGENMHPEEIEKALTSIRGIEEAVVAPAPDSEYGMRPVAWIRCASGEAPADDVIVEKLVKLIGRLKTPVSFTRVDEWRTIPGSAKIDRKWYGRQALSTIPASPGASAPRR